MFSEREESMEPIVGIYCRLSKEDRYKISRGDDSESIQNQKSMLIKYARERGWKIYQIYSDDDYTGSDRNRPQFNQLLKDAEAGKINIILCKNQARFCREMEIVEKYIHGYFIAWGVRFIGIADNADTFVKGNKKARQINGLINEWYLEDLSSNVKSALDDKRSDGLHIGSSAPYGYLKDPQRKGHLIVDREAAEIVHEIFEMFASGYGKTRIARELNQREIPNPTRYKYLNGQSRREKSGDGSRSHLWGYSTISKMLVNEVYIGNMIQGKTGTISYKIKKKRYKPKEQWYCREQTHEAIIEKELWDRVQQLTRQRTTVKQNGRVRVLAGKVRCAGCGYALNVSLAHGYRYLRCKTTMKYGSPCVGCCIREDELKQYIMKAYQEMTETYLLVDQAERMITLSDERQKKRERIRKERVFHEREKEKKENALKALYLDKITGDITPEEYRAFSEAFRKDIARCNKLIEDASGQLRQLEQEGQEESEKQELLKKYQDIKELNYDIMNTFIDHIEVGKRKTRKEEHPITIFWKF